MKIAQFNRFEVELPDEAVRDCYHQGACDTDVDFWEPKIKIKASATLIKAELREYGAWDKSELKDRTQNKKRIIWLAAAQVQEDEEEVSDFIR